VVLREKTMQQRRPRAWHSNDEDWGDDLFFTNPRPGVAVTLNLQTIEASLPTLFRRASLSQEANSRRSGSRKASSPKSSNLARRCAAVIKGSAPRGCFINLDVPKMWSVRLKVL